MSKYKPNEPCYCKSGKKYKKCHGATGQNMTSNSFNQKWSSYPELDGTWGLDGMGISMSLLRGYKDPNDPRNSALPSGTKGKYKVSFILSRPNHAPVDEKMISFDIDKVTGDSHLFLGSPDDSRMEVKLSLLEEDFIFYGYPNEKGYLHKIEIEEIEATSFKNATLKAHNALSSALSRFSLLLNIPLHIYQTLVVENSTQNLMTNINLPFSEIQFQNIGELPADKNFAKYASLYREALNSNSPNYQYLCFYKIIEGLRKTRDEKNRIENQSYLAKGEKPPSKEVERIPDTAEGQKSWLNALFRPLKWSSLALEQIFPKEAVGRKINDLINPSKELDTVRNKIAHAVMRDETQETFNLDEGLHLDEVYNWLPLCKCLAIYLLKKDYTNFFSI